MSEYTAEEKLNEINRELRMRRALYPRWVADGKLTSRDAAHQIEILDEIAADYEQLAQKERLL